MNANYRERLKDKKRIVIKIGSSSLIHAETGRLDFRKLEILARELSDLHNQGKDVVLVSSGAIAVGAAALGMKGKPAELEKKQACAAVGQARLMTIYQKLFGEYNQMVAQILKEKMNLEEKEDFIATRKGVLDPNTLSKEARMELIKEKPEYGNIICRCEVVTEGEIMDAINRPLGAKSLDGVKRRTRAGMGRCQAGFCSPRTMEILARERHVSMFEITKSGGDSKIVTGTNKDSL